MGSGSTYILEGGSAESQLSSNAGKNRQTQGVPTQSLYSKGINSLGTTKASSIPIPLLVLAGLGALLLVSAGGLAASKRLKGRALRPPA